MAAYVSVERIRFLPSNGEIEWIMATASDAGGVLPQFIQNLAVPGAIAKDGKFSISILTQCFFLCELWTWELSRVASEGYLHLSLSP